MPIGTMSPVSSARWRNCGGGEDAELRVLPAQQRLDRDDLGPGEAHDRLVVDAELAAVDGVAHRVPQRRLVACVGPDCRLDAVVFPLPLDRPLFHRLVPWIAHSLCRHSGG